MFSLASCVISSVRAAFYFIQPFIHDIFDDNDIAIVLALSLTNAPFLTGVFGLLCCPTGIRGEGTRVFERRDRTENTQ